jgi:alpha-D-ribose 1-methylphosphonate 5-triphosphate synthase subunit PhnH
MGKIGDLFVRLGLKSDGFKKGMQEAKKETRDFGSKLGQLKAGALAVWAAIGAGVTKVAKDFIEATNATSDAWAEKTAGMKAAWQSFLADIQNSNTTIRDIFANLTDPGKKAQNFFRRLFKATVAKESAEEMTKAFDEEFELEHSVRLQRLAVQQELNDLYAKMRDTTLSNADRRAAADRYRALLQPIAEAETATYETMMNSAIDAWQKGLSNRSREEVIEFFTNIGTDAERMAAKFPDLMNIFQNFKSDKENLPIFDIIAKFQQASNQMSQVDKEMSRTTNSIKANIKRELEDIAAAVKEYGQEGLNLDLEIDVELDWEKDEYEALIEWINQESEALINEQKQRIDEIIAQNKMLEDTIISSMSNGLQALTDLAFGIEGAGWEQILAGVLQPFAQSATQLGEMLVAQGIAIGAFKESLKSLKPGVAIAAGLSLIAVGAAISSGIKALAGGPAGGTTASTGAGTTSAGGIETYEQEITVHVVGEISGNNIVLAGQKTLNKWNR